MKGAAFTIERVFNASIGQAWQALTEKSKLKEWYFAQVKEFEPVAGFRFKFIPDGSGYVKEWVVTDVVEKRKFAHTWAYKGYSGSSEVIFELFEEGHKTRLKLTHNGLDTFPDDPHFERRNFESGWNRIIGSNLKHFLE